VAISKIHKTLVATPMCLYAYVHQILLLFRFAWSASTTIIARSLLRIS